MVNYLVTAALRRLHADTGSYISWLPLDMMMGMLVRYFDALTWKTGAAFRTIYHQSGLSLDSDNFDCLALRTGEIIMYSRDTAITSMRLCLGDDGRYHSGVYHDFYSTFASFLAGEVTYPFDYKLYEHFTNGYWASIAIDEHCNDYLLHCDAGLGITTILRRYRILHLLCDNGRLYVLWHNEQMELMLDVLSASYNVDVSVVMPSERTEISLMHKCDDHICVIPYYHNSKCKRLYFNVKSSAITIECWTYARQCIDGHMCSNEGDLYYFYVLNPSAKVNWVCIHLNNSANPVIKEILNIFGHVQMNLLPDGRFLLWISSNDQQQILLLE